MTRPMPIERNSHRGASGRDRFPKEIPCRFNIPVLTQPEVDRPALVVRKYSIWRGRVGEKLELQVVA